MICAQQVAALDVCADMAWFITASKLPSDAPHPRDMSPLLMDLLRACHRSDVLIVMCNLVARVQWLLARLVYLIAGSADACLRHLKVASAALHTLSTVLPSGPLTLVHVLADHVCDMATVDALLRRIELQQQVWCGVCAAVLRPLTSCAHMSHAFV